MTSPPRLYTVEEYLALDGAAPDHERFEYANGHVFPMTGASGNHEQLVVNVSAALHAGMRGRPCRVYGSNLRVAVRASRAYKYPDLSGLCGRPEFEAADSDNFVNPSFIVEVLSPSTEANDRGAKFAHYQLIPSLSEYLLVAQDHRRIERFLRRGTSWQLDQFTHANEVVALPSVDCALRVGDVYEMVDFPDEIPPAAPRLVREPDAPEWAAI